MTREIDPAKLQELIDRSEIHQLMMRYSRGIDRADSDLIASTFHEGAMDDHGDGYRDPSYLWANSGSRGGPLKAMMHFIGNEFVELEGDVAFSETYFISYSTIVSDDGPDKSRSRGGRYLDRLERRDGEWKIAVRKVVDEWSRVDEITERAVGPGNAGVRGPEDFVYALRELEKQTANQKI